MSHQIHLNDANDNVDYYMRQVKVKVGEPNGEATPAKCTDKLDVNEKKEQNRLSEESDESVGDLPEIDKGSAVVKKWSKTATIFFNNFDIPDDTFWTPKYINRPETVQCLVQQYAEYAARIRIAYANVENNSFFDGYSDYHTHRYLLVTLVGENNIDGSTSLDELEQYLRRSDGSVTSLKINNLHNAMTTLFPNVFQFVNGETKIQFRKFTPKFIIDLHKMVMSNLTEHVGVYRMCWAAPSQENWLYLVPQKISEHLEALCTELRMQLEIVEDEDSKNSVVIRRVKIVANFLTHFLQIHPFKNGNGRVARLLISWLMADLTVVPTPLLTTLKFREIYLDCLRDSRCKSPFIPANLARFIFECVVNTLRNVCVSLDI